MSNGQSDAATLRRRVAVKGFESPSARMDQPVNQTNDEPDLDDVPPEMLVGLNVVAAETVLKYLKQLEAVEP